MKKIYFKLIGLTMGVFMLTSNKTNAQVYVIGNGEYATSVSNDGNVVVLFGLDNNYYWTKYKGVQQLGEIVPGSYNGGVSTVTADGKIISTNVVDPKTGINQIATYNLEKDEWNYLGGLGKIVDSETSSVWGMTGNGSSIVGIASTSDGYGHAVKWTKETGLVDLGSTTPKSASRANAISEDGTMIAGWQDDKNGARYGAYWKNGVQHLIKDNSGNPVYEISSVSGDGKWLLGSQFEYAMKWSEETGVQLIRDSNADPFYVGAATATNYDGSVIVGYYREFPGPAMMGDGFIWTKETGKISLDEYVKNLGYDNLGITFSLPYAISKDGTKIVGVGRTTEEAVSFMISLPKLGTSEVNQVEYSVFPNPTSDIINIETKGKLSSSILYNMTGQKVLSTNEKQLNISSLPKGTYVLKTIIDGNENTKKIIKK